jgi:hypothetical protein
VVLSVLVGIFAFVFCLLCYRKDVTLRLVSLDAVRRNESLDLDWHDLHHFDGLTRLQTGLIAQLDVHSWPH